MIFQVVTDGRNSLSPQVGAPVGFVNFHCGMDTFYAKQL